MGEAEQRSRRASPQRSMRRSVAWAARKASVPLVARSVQVAGGSQVGSAGERLRKGVGTVKYQLWSAPTVQAIRRRVI